MLFIVIVQWGVTVSPGSCDAPQHDITYKMPKKKFNLAVCLGTQCSVVSDRKSFSILNACGNVTNGNTNHMEYFRVSTTNIMYGVNNKMAYNTCDADRPIIIANVTIPAALSFCASRVLLLCKIASVFKASGMAK